jgi:hypothetical protein
MTDKSKAEHQYGERFCLMLYQGQKTGRIVDIWNSRNGVTPFMVDIDGETYQHVHFQRDRPAPDHQLRPGDYFFRGITEAEAERYAAMVADRMEPNASERRRAKLIAELTPEMYKHSTGEVHPYLDRAPFITVDDHG